MPSKRLSVMQRQIQELRKQFLPDPFNPLGAYPNQARIQLHTRAFLVLSHAEIESYLEDRARDIARAAEALWLKDRRVSGPMVYLLCCLADPLEVPRAPSNSSAKDLPQKLDENSVKLFQRYYKCVNDNNGIKEGNLLALYSPLGLPPLAFGATLIPNLDYIGKLRGVHAHRSAQAVRSVLDPEVEYQRVSNVLNDLIVFDCWLSEYRRRIR